MRKPLYLSLAIYFAAITGICRACMRVKVESDTIGDIIFAKSNLRALGSQGRSSYVSEENGRVQHLYFVVTNTTLGIGRWVINDEHAVADRASAYVGQFAALITLLSSECRAAFIK